MDVLGTSVLIIPWVVRFGESWWCGYVSIGVEHAVRDILLGLALVVLAGCGLVDETPVASPTAARTAVSTGTSMAAPSATITITPTPTYIPYPSSMPFPIPMPYGFYGYSASPNGEWIAWMVDTGDDPYLLIESVDRRKRWKINFDFATIAWNSDLRIIHWSGDGRYLYYATSPPGNGIGFDVVQDLQKLDLFTGLTNEILPYEAGNWYAIAISHGEGWLAYIPRDTLVVDLIIRNLTNEEEFKIRLGSGGNLYTGALLWTLDESKIFFVIYDESGYNIARVELLTREIKYLLRDFTYIIYATSWEDSKESLIRFKSEEGDWILNVETGELTPIEE